MVETPTAYIHEWRKYPGGKIRPDEEIIPGAETIVLFERPAGFLTRQLIQITPEGRLVAQILTGDDEAIQGTDEYPIELPKARRFFLTRRGIVVETIRPA
jgi:hypothetical protein